MFKKIPTYKTLDELPIWNYYMMGVKDDLRYLLKRDSYADLPQLKERLHLQLAYTYHRLMEESELPESHLSKLKRQVILAINELVIEIATNSQDIEKIEQASILLRGLMIDSDPKIEWLHVDWHETAKQKQLSARAEVAIKRYLEHKKDVDSAPDADIYEQAATIEAVVGVKLDVKKCSVMEWMAYQKLIKKRANGRG